MQQRQLLADWSLVLDNNSYPTESNQHWNQRQSLEMWTQWKMLCAFETTRRRIHVQFELNEELKVIEDSWGNGKPVVRSFFSTRCCVTNVFVLLSKTLFAVLRTISLVGVWSCGSEEIFFQVSHKVPITVQDTFLHCFPCFIKKLSFSLHSLHFTRLAVQFSKRFQFGKYAFTLKIHTSG